MTSLWSNTIPQEPSSGPSSWGLLLMIMPQELPLILQAMSMSQDLLMGGLDGNSSAGNRDLFIIKYNSSGTKQWTKQLGKQLLMILPMELPLILQAISMSLDIQVVDWTETRVREVMTSS